MLKVESLSARHDRKTFDCGVDALNIYLQRTARQHADKGISRTFVLTDATARDTILGFVTLSVCEVDASALPPTYAKKLPRTVPAARLARLAVDRRHRRKGYGEALMSFALGRALRVADSVGLIGLFVDAKDDDASAFYRRYGFLTLPDDGLKLFLPMATIAGAGRK